MLIDSNIIIYASKPGYGALRRFIADRKPAVSAVSYVEVLGYDKLLPEERHFLEQFFSLVLILPLSWDVIEHAERLRQIRRMTLGDALVAGTALVFNKTLVTRNVNDFMGIDQLSVLNPFDTDV